MWLEVNLNTENTEPIEDTNDSTIINCRAMEVSMMKLFERTKMTKWMVWKCSAGAWGQCIHSHATDKSFTLNDNKWSIHATSVILILKNFRKQITMWQKINVCSKLTNPFSLNDASQQSDEDVLLSRTFLLNEHLEGLDPEEKGKKEKACLLELSLPVVHSFDYWSLI